MKRMLVTGGGFLGRYVAKELLSNGYEVLVVTRSENNAQLLADFVAPAHVEVLLQDVATLTLRDVGLVNGVVHTAAMKYIDLCGTHHDEAIQANITCTKHLLDLFDGISRHVVHISTDKVCEATTFYGATKLIAERMAQQSGATVVRLPNLFGSTGSVVPRWSESVRSTGTIKVTNRDMSRYFCHPASAARLIRRALETPQPGKVLIPDAYEVNIGMLATLVGERTGLPFKVEIVGSRPHEKLREVLSLPDEDSVVQGALREATEHLVNCWVTEFVPQMGCTNINTHPYFPEG